MPAALTKISHVPELLHPKEPHHALATCWRLSKHHLSSYIWHTCNKRSLATKNTRLTTSLVTFCSRLCSSSATALACAFSIHSERWKHLAKKEVPSHCIWWDSADSFPCPHFVYPEKSCHSKQWHYEWISCLNTLKVISSMLPHVAYIWTRVVPTKTSHS